MWRKEKSTRRSSFIQMSEPKCLRLSPAKLQKKLITAHDHRWGSKPSRSICKWKNCTPAQPLFTTMVQYNACITAEAMAICLSVTRFIYPHLWTGQGYTWTPLLRQKLIPNMIFANQLEITVKWSRQKNHYMKSREATLRSPNCQLQEDKKSHIR